MALKPDNEKHATQIEAGTIGRQKGHKFEADLTQHINNLNPKTLSSMAIPLVHLDKGHPAERIVKYIAVSMKLDLSKIKKITAWWVGALATSGQGDVLLDASSNCVKKCKSDIVIILDYSGVKINAGVSVKTCSKATPTNDQLFFTTASAFCQLLRNNSIPVSDDAEIALRMFCGDKGYRPIDGKTPLALRKSDPERWYWEEIPNTKGRSDLEQLFNNYQDEISFLLLQKAYLNDPFPPDFVLHQTVAYSDINSCETALFTIKELVSLSRQYSGFSLKPYTIKKGRFKGDPTTHYAPRFGFIQFQRGGQKQHPTQLQFNLQAGYFYKI